MELAKRPRRNRKSASLREAMAETTLGAEHLVQPLFVSETTQDIASLPGQKKFSLKDLEQFCKSKLATSPIMGVLLFASIESDLKTPQAKEALNPKGLLPEAIQILKEHCPHLEVMSDVALDPFSSDGHDGLVRDQEILNDETVDILKEMSLIHAQAGVDWVAPSDMMDGRVGAIRTLLDSYGFEKVSVLSYTAKYASSFYGPFRGALDSAPKFGDKKTYQMDVRNRKEALRELYEDLSEGADMIMVKPALSYLDVILDLSRESTVPVAAYNVSGEYSMVQLAEKQGLLNGKAVQKEVLTSIRRAGAQVIVSYGALEFAQEKLK